jgi:PBP1b-binding outer membrane lipoprotein LpoB
MRLFLFSIIPLIAVTVIFSGCCNCEDGSNSVPDSTHTNEIIGEGFVNIEIAEAWIDLMPGGPAGFLFTGEATIAAWETPEFDSIKCKDAEIIVAEKVVAKFPFVIVQIENKLQKPGKSSNILVRFSSKERNKVDGLMDAGKISIKLNIEYKGKHFTGKSDGIEVKRTY